VKRRTQWIPILVLLLLPLLAACGLNRFGADGWAGLTIQDNTLYAVSGDGRVIALDISRDSSDSGGNPSRVWGPFPSTDDDELGAVYAAPALGAYSSDGGSSAPSIFIATYEDAEGDDDIAANLISLGATTGIQNWGAEAPGKVVGSPTLVGNTLVATTTDGIIYALALEADERALPRTAWRNFEADGEIWSAATAANGILYFGTLEHTVYAVNAEDGEELWNRKVDGGVVGSPLVFGNTVYVGTLDRNIYALDAVTGELKWKFSGDNWFWASPVTDGTTIYAATLGGAVYAIDLTGREVWSSPTKVSGPVLASPLILSDTLVVATDSKQVHQLSLIDGREEWAISVGEQVRAGMASQDDRVYLIDNDGVVHALDAERRIELWTYDTDQ
jgi:outer membrane protein assembly factor BamB